MPSVAWLFSQPLLANLSNTQCESELLQEDKVVLSAFLRLHRLAAISRFQSLVLEQSN